MRAPLLNLLTLLILAPATMTLGCDDLRTESGEFGVSFPDFGQVPGESPFPALEGTLLCDAESRCSACESSDESVPPLCEDHSLTVDAVADASGCYPVELGAPVLFGFAPEMCTSDVPEESLVVQAIGSADVDGRLGGGYFEEGAAAVLNGGPVEAMGDPLLTVSSLVPLQVLAGEERVSLEVVLEERSSGRRIGWNPSQGMLTLTPITGDAVSVVDDMPSLYVEASSGARSSAALTVNGAEFPLADIVAVDASAIDHIAITALFSDDGDDGHRPIALEAHVLDDQGKAIVGVPVEWRIVEGGLVLGDSTDNVGAYADVSECIPSRRKDRQRAVVEASYGEHTTSLEVEWDEYKGDLLYLPSDCADEGCGCRSSAPSGWSGLLLGVMLLLRRRRSR